MWSQIPTEWAVAVITGVLGFIGNKLWNRATDNQRAILEATLGEARAVVRSLVDTAPAGTTTQQIEIWCKGAIAIQLAKRDIDPNNPLVKAMVAETIAHAIATFVAQHPDQKSLTVPIAAKLRPAA